jgi:hypothetical protein
MTSSHEKLTPSRGTSVSHRSTRDELALLDSAHSAIAEDLPDRALEMARCYATRYPMGAFRREADALRIHALVMLGRGDEASELAEIFAAEHGASPLSRRLFHMAKPRGS